MLFAQKDIVSISEILHQLSGTCGFAFESPETRRVIVYSNSTRIPNFTESDLFDRLGEEQNLSFQVWWELGWDMLCQVECFPDSYSLRIWLEGVRDADRKRLLSAVMDLLERYTGGFPLIVVDGTGDTAEFDFGHVRQTGLREVYMLPEMLLVDESIRLQIESDKERVGFSSVGNGMYHVLPLSD